MVMNDPKDPFYFSRNKVLLWGTVVALALCALVILFVPTEPKNSASTEPLSNKSAEAMFKKEEVARTPPEQYAKFCAACHGDTGDANTQMARMMSVKPTNLNSGPFKFERTPEAIRNLIRYGSQVMPGFEREISEPEADALAQYVLKLEVKK